MLKATLASALYFFISFWSSAHEIKAALFRLYAADDSYRLEIRIDQENLEEAVSEGCAQQINASDLDDVTPLEDYLRSNFTMNLNGLPRDFEVTSLVYNDGYAIVQAVLEGNKVQEPLSKIEVINTCLLDHVDDHDNIILVQLNDRTRSFRLNKKLQSTTIDY